MVTGNKQLFWALLGVANVLTLSTTEEELGGLFSAMKNAQFTNLYGGLG